jgi:hypothetical protein
LNGIQRGIKLIHSGRFAQAQFVKDILVVDEAVNHGSHRHTELVGTIIGNPGGFGD